MKKILVLSLLALSTTLGYADDKLSVPTYGVEQTDSHFFEDRYLHNSLSHYLSTLNDFVVWESAAMGEYNQPEQYLFSVAGNSFKWNRYYLDGFRIDSRFQVGSTQYHSNLYNQNLGLDYYQSSIYFDTKPQIANSVTADYNMGGLGGVSAGTAQLIQLFHRTASERAYMPLDQRAGIVGSGSVTLDHTIEVGGESYQQQLYAQMGQRTLSAFNNKGLSHLFPENYGKVQLNGALPIQGNSLFDTTHYLLHYTQRDNLNSEFYYSEAETAQLNSFGASIYGKKRGERLQYTSGVTFASNRTTHDDLNFSRNIIDQDGEAFDPWSPDGTTYDLSHALTLNYALNSWLDLKVETYNSLIYFTPQQTQFQNSVYAQYIVNDLPTSLYLYDWQSSAFWSGLLENSVGVNTTRQLAPWATFRADAEVTLDAMLLDQKSMVRPNWQAQAGFNLTPTSWFTAELNLAKKRVAFNMDDIRYLSNDYLSGNIYYWQDGNNDLKAQEGEYSNYFTSTGGSSRSVSDGLARPSYFVVDLPMHFHHKGHLLTIQPTYRKYYNNWYTSYADSNSQLGYYQPVGEQEVFFLNGGSPTQYVVELMPKELMQSNLLTDTPYYFSANVKYQYTNPKFTFSISWQSFLMSGISTLGNGPLHNNVGVLSESSANPNTLLNTDNAESQYAHVGRLNQDRAYMSRLFAAYNVNSKLNFAFNGFFVDGQPFTSFDSQIATDQNGNNQIAIWPHRTKGINTFDDDFGSREDAIFNFELRATYRMSIGKHDVQLQAICYNFYDFGNSLNEYTFVQEIPTRSAMSLTMPRGASLSAKIYLDANKK